MLLLKWHKQLIVVICTLFLFSVYADHSHSAQIKERQSKLDVACSDLQQHCTARSQRLQESLKLQEFYRRAEEEEAWMKEKEQIVSSSEVGRGLSHVLRLVYVHVSVISASIKYVVSCCT